MQFFGSLAVTLMSACVVYRAYQRSRSLDLSLSALVLFVWGCWFPLGIVRSQLAGMLCFVLLLTMITSHQRRGWQWCAVPLLFAAWVNLDGSFPVGLALSEPSRCYRQSLIVWKLFRAEKCDDPDCSFCAALRVDRPD